MSRTKFTATYSQVLIMAALAANASIPVGMGYLHYKPDKKFDAHSMREYMLGDDLHCDYVQGRCVKLHVLRGEKLKRGAFSWITGHETRLDYETWGSTYPTYGDLLKAAGITEFEVIE